MSTISGPPSMLVSNEGQPPPPPITSEQVLGLLIGEKEEDKFYFGKSLFHYDYHETDSDNVGYNMNNICEIYLKIEKGAKQKGWLSHLNPKDSLHTTHYDKKLKDEGYKVSASIFSVPRENLVRFSEIIAESLNKSEVKGIMRSI
tara:strand:+ start:19 stop:453 length:435 start_codon:yes stop_codon:yes gene_type:complete